ncbi:insulinase family protein [Candidatus Peregrinibacteria bacterium]|nr:insulinase family protein [Candidatus Peregrinibacteria bacterium]
MFQQHSLPNNLRLITSQNTGTKAVTLLILTGAGSRNEKDEERGISHFLEHMFFKGGARYKNAKEVAETIDGVGGDFNAFTGKEYAGYYVKVSAEQVETSFNVLSDMLLNSIFSPHEIEKERGVILEEFNMYEDTPIYKIGWDFEELLFGSDHPMGRDEIGTKEFIAKVTQQEFQDYKSALYTPENTVIIASGNISPEKSLELAKQYFQFPAAKRTRHHIDFAWPKNPERLHLRNKKTEQAHLVVGYPGLPMAHKDEHVLNLLAVILGGNMSSRMFLNIREAHGLCYSISTTTDRYTDCGVISTHAGVDIARVEKAITAIRQEYEKITAEKISDEELQKAKNFLKGKITLRMEDSEEVASFLGTQALLLPEIKTLKQLFAKIDAVSADDILRVSRAILIPEKLSLALIGPFEGKEEEFRKLLG